MLPSFNQNVLADPSKWWQNTSWLLWLPPSAASRGLLGLLRISLTFSPPHLFALLCSKAQLYVKGKIPSFPFSKFLRAFFTKPQPIFYNVFFLIRIT
jgi:hypothetical protein